MKLYAHPFSSYSQKVLIALWENATPFTYRSLEEPSANAELEKLWPLKKFPVLVDGDEVLIETTVIIEYLAVRHPGPVDLVPRDDWNVRFMDRFFDNYINETFTVIVYNARRPEDQRDPYGVQQARDELDQAYAYLNDKLGDKTWACGEAFTMADCAAAPSLFYADWAHPIADKFARVKAYRARLLERPSVKRAVDGGRPYRHYFPLGAPNRD